jgi:hypothetical protein
MRALPQGSRPHSIDLRNIGHRSALPIERGSDMPKYHFEIIDGYLLEDPVGMDCQNDDQAKVIAHDIAHQIALDIESQTPRNVVVIDEDGAEIYQTPIEP